MRAAEFLVVGLSGVALLLGVAIGCRGTTADANSGTASSFDDDASLPPVISTVTLMEPTAVPDAMPASITLASIDATAGGEGDASIASDEASTNTRLGPPFDAGEGGTCDRSLAFGDLRIDELMIASVKGSGDDGEWLEVASALDCAIDLIGLHGEAPRAAKVATFDVVDHLWLPARGTLVVADSTDPAINHYLPGTLVGWFGHPGDVLRNQGTSITLTLGGALVDSITYPALSLTPGTSLAFPADCDASARTDWTTWQASTASWFPGFQGTPNAPNDDVHCP